MLAVVQLTAILKESMYVTYLDNSEYVLHTMKLRLRYALTIGKIGNSLIATGMIGGIITAFPMLLSENEMIYKLGSAAIFVCFTTWLFLLGFYVPLLLMFGPDYNWGRLFSIFDPCLYGGAQTQRRGRQIKAKEDLGGSGGSRVSDRSSVASQNMPPGMGQSQNLPGQGPGASPDLFAIKPQNQQQA